ncbi:TIGR01440 family protein [Bacillus sp. FJAT-44742]|uniref:TIGR01440 family protein n=1 Tax=Bacillus sp. FJAT-44742 TaxID=2014005 RepID=UPI003FA41CEA
MRGENVNIQTEIRESLSTALQELSDVVTLNDRHIFLIGASTSEVLGKRIGSAGSEEAAEEIFSVLQEFQEKTGVHLAFQGCEHINRALVIESRTAERFSLEEVTVVPHAKAGGAMASYAYQQFRDPVVTEFVKADAGIDIGDTLIGMHLKHVAIPVRSSIKEIGAAHLTMAKTRPKLIGGSRARYPIVEK